MRKQLYKVTITAYVMAESDGAAEHVPVDQSQCDAQAEPATSVPLDWVDSIPFGEDYDRTCRQILRGEG